MYLSASYVLLKTPKIKLICYPKADHEKNGKAKNPWKKNTTTNPRPSHSYCTFIHIPVSLAAIIGFRSSSFAIFDTFNETKAFALLFLLFYLNENGDCSQVSCPYAYLFFRCITWLLQKQPELMSST